VRAVRPESCAGRGLTAPTRLGFRSCFEPSTSLRAQHERKPSIEQPCPLRDVIPLNACCSILKRLGAMPAGEAMKQSAFIVLSVLAVLPVAAGAQSVFRCAENGKTTFTSNPTGPSCQPLDIRADDPPVTEDLARKQRELEEWNQRREEEVQQSLARESAAETQRRKGELAALGRGEARSDGYRGRRHYGSRRHWRR
jgi:hypothetical protein